MSKCRCDFKATDLWFRWHATRSAVTMADYVHRDVEFQIHEQLIIRRFVRRSFGRTGIVCGPFKTSSVFTNDRALTRLPLEPPFITNIVHTEKKRWLYVDSSNLSFRLLMRIANIGLPAKVFVFVVTQKKLK